MSESLDGKHATSDAYHRSFQGSRMSDSLSMASDYYYDPFCEVCYEGKNRNVKHEWFCKDCVQYLCGDCLQVHRKLQGTRGHVIQRGDDMPKSMADKPPKFDYCYVHQRSRKDQFCGTHKVLMCSQCVPLQHKNCPVESVEDACKGVSTSEIDALYDKVCYFHTNLSSVVTQIDLNITGLGKQKVDLLKDALDKKVKSITRIEKLFKEMASEAESKFQAHISTLRQGKDNLNDAIVNLEGTRDDIDKMKGTSVDTKVFLKIQDILNDFERCKSDVKKLRPLTMNVKMSFIPDELLSTPFKLGSISFDTSQPRVTISEPEVSFPMSPARSLPMSQGRSSRPPTRASGQLAGKTIPLSQVTAKKLDSYNVKLDDDKSDCSITGIAITNDGRRLLVDNGNEKIKMFSRDMTSLCSLPLSTQPWDIAVTGDRGAVISCYEAMLLILAISDRKMSIKTTIKLPFRAAGIAPYKDKLLVTSESTSPSSVKLIDHSGRVYWSTDADQQGRQLFSRPEYVTCYDNGGSSAVIVSDDDNNTLTVLNAVTGDIIARRHVKGWFQGKCPQDVTTDTADNIYVCYYRTDEVAVLAKDLSQEKILLSKKDGLSSEPQAIVYDAVNHQLLVSYASDSMHILDCFQLQ